LDRRTWLSHFVEQTEAMLSEDAGGPEHLTHRETLMVSMAATLWTEFQLMVWQRQQGILRGQHDHESDKYFLAHVNALRRTLETLGLRPSKTEQLPSLADYIASKANGGDGTPGNAAASQGNEHSDGEPPLCGGGVEARTEDAAEGGNE